LVFDMDTFHLLARPGQWVDHPQKSEYPLLRHAACCPSGDLGWRGVLAGALRGSAGPTRPRFVAASASRGWNAHARRRSKSHPTARITGCGQAV